MVLLRCWLLPPLLTLLFCAPAVAVEFSVFGDVSVTGGDGDHDKTSFNLGALDLYSSHDVSENTSAFMEVVFEDPGDGFIVDVERLWIKHAFKPSFALSAGRFHTPLGFWNYNYHHGVLIQDTVSRPFFLEFEEGHEGLFPTHLVGLVAEGRWFAGQSVFGYQLGVGNGPSVDTTEWTPASGAELEVKNVADLNDGKLLVGRLAYTHMERRFQFGVFGMRNDIVEGGAEDPTDNASLRPRGADLFFQTVAGVDMHWSFKRLYVMGEYYLLRTTDNIPTPAITVNPGRHDSHAYYVQVGWRATAKLTPVYRISANAFTEDDSYYRLLGVDRETHHVVAFRYEVDPSNAIRMEVNHAQPDGAPEHTSVTLQWFFLLL